MHEQGNRKQYGAVSVVDVYPLLRTVCVSAHFTLRDLAQHVKSFPSGRLHVGKVRSFRISGHAVAVV